VLELAVDSAHELGLNEPPLPPSLHETAPEGEEGAPPVSVTVAVHAAAAPIVTGFGTEATEVVVGSA